MPSRNGKRDLKVRQAVGSFNDKLPGLTNCFQLFCSKIRIVGEAVRRVRASLAQQVPVQVEVSDLAELDEALEAGADLILLDNFDLEMVETAVQRVGEDAVLEVSGGVSPEQAETLARRTGVPRISMGLLTRGAVWCDLSMDIVLAAEKG